MQQAIGKPTDEIKLVIAEKSIAHPPIVSRETFFFIITQKAGIIYRLLLR